MNLLLVILNFLVIGITPLYLDYYLMDTVFGPRNGYSPFIFWGYLIFADVFNGYLAYVNVYGGASFPVETVSAIWTYVSAIVALCVVCSTWKGDVVQVGVAQVIADVFSGMCGTLGITIANMMMGYGVSLGYFRPFSVHTVLAAGISLMLILLIRVPVTSIVRAVVRVVKRHRIPWAIVGILLIAAFSSVSFIGYSQLDPWFVVMSVIEPLFAAALVVVLLRKSREVAQRGKLLSQCLETANAYKELMGERLLSLERDLAVLEGHEGTLERLRTSENECLAERIDKLQKAYARLRSGSYCDRPALDAILMSSAERLRDLGVRPELSVAGVPADRPIDMMLAMSLLNLACSAASRQGDDVVRGSEASFRIRGHGRGVLYRLDVPAPWGYLGARRSLAIFPEDDSLLVQERVRDGRSVVLVMSGAGE